MFHEKSSINVDGWPEERWGYSKPLYNTIETGFLVESLGNNVAEGTNAALEASSAANGTMKSFCDVISMISADVENEKKRKKDTIAGRGPPSTKVGHAVRRGRPRIARSIRGSWTTALPVTAPTRSEITRGTVITRFWLLRSTEENRDTRSLSDSGRSLPRVDNRRVP